MEEIRIDVDLDKEIKKRRIKEKIFSKVQKTKEFVVKNKESVIRIAPFVIGGIATVYKVAGKRLNLRKEENLKDLYCYDRSLGHYWKLRRKLTNDEWLEIDRRKKNGERLSDILEELKVLK